MPVASANGPDYQEAISDFQRGGWITVLLGMLGMAIRLLVSDEKSTWIWWVRKLIAAGMSGILAYFLLWGVDMHGLYKSVILTTSGMVCPELVEIARKAYIKKTKNL